MSDCNLKDALVGRSGLTSAQVNQVKGVFILLIVLGHNPVMSSSVGWLQGLLYSFHIYAFFILPFFFVAKPIVAGGLVTLAVRYVYPFVLWVTISTVLYRCFYASDETVSSMFNSLLKALVIGTAPMLKPSCGFQLYWFLPALMFMSLIRSLLCRASFPINAIWSVACFVVLASIGWRGDLFTHYQVWSCLSVMAVWPICQLSMTLHSWLITISAGRVVFPLFLLLLVSLWKIMLDGSGGNLAILALVTIEAPLSFVLQALVPALAFNFIVSLIRLNKVPSVFSKLGECSLLIYLMHSFVFYGLAFCASFCLNEAALNSYCWAVVSFMMTVIISYGISLMVLSNKRVRSLLIPRSIGDLRLSFRIR